jgi:hypothetical protein
VARAPSDSGSAVFPFLSDGGVWIGHQEVAEMRKTMTRKHSLGFVGIALAGMVACQPVEVELEDFRNGVPRQETVEMKVPAGSGQALSTVETHTQALRGATADFYVLTRAVSGVVNGGVALTLVLLKAVVAHEPTSLSGDTAVWGPWHGPLDPVSWRLTVKHEGDHEYSYELAGRERLSRSDAFTVVLTGTHTASVDGNGRAIEGFGSGELSLDWDARAKLPLAGREVGNAKVTYSRTSPSATVEIDAEFHQVHNDNRPGQRVDASYRFRATPGAGGSMQFVHEVPAQMSQNGSRWAVKSRWDQDGAGRADIRATGGDLPTTFQATASECWNTGFASVFFQANWPLAPSYGDEAASCVFKSAEWASL